ncbi:hypothetical protein AOLI_G00273450 [Acnodon oligacanthus]
MSSVVDRQAVLRTTKVRTALKKDGSWIRCSIEEPEDTQPHPNPQTPTSLQDTPTPSESKGRPGRSYVLSALRKFEPEPRSNTAVKSPVKASIVEIPAFKTPIIRTPAIKAPPVETLTAQTPAIQKPAVKSPEVKTPGVEAPAAALEQRAELQINSGPAAAAQSPVGGTINPQTTSHGKLLCSFCSQPIDGNVKISLNVPQICCHPECFKCGKCRKPLGDLLFSMFHHSGNIYCENCFDTIFHSR